ncbi:MAG: hypothetical protein WBL05_12720 [Brooklawnia sp.]|uniref:hypothetical protein n=1 Tax=Brooklawnia sp. TaxID=2699740 RepID=UPI003C768CF0
MARDPRDVNDLSRIVDSVFKPRRVPGSRRGRLLIVFALFLVVEAAFVIQLLAQGQPLGIPGLLWGVWLAVCLAWIFVPRLGAAADAPGNQQAARNILLIGLGIGLLTSAAGTLDAVNLPGWWLVLVISLAVAASGLVLGVLELRPQPPS